MTKRKPNPDIYALKWECLADLEARSESGQIDVIYGDASSVSLLPNVPYSVKHVSPVLAILG